MPIAARLTRGTVGAVFEGDGTRVGVFGEAPSLGLASPRAPAAPDGVRNADGTRMDVIWPPGSSPYFGTTRPRMPFDLGHDTAVLVPAARLAAEAGRETTNMAERQER